MGKDWKDAPAAEEVRVSGDRVFTEWMCGIVYCAPGLSNIDPEEVRCAFRKAIASCRSISVITSYMNNMLGLDGEMDIITNWDSGLYMNPNQ